MHIVTPEKLTDLLYDVETAIPPSKQLCSVGSGTRVRVGIGRPVQWRENELLGEGWRPPMGEYRHYLVRLAFSIQCLGHTRPESADFSLKLHPESGRSGIIFDAYPQELLTEISHPVTIGVGADFKLGPAQVSLGKAETTIDFGRCIPAIKSYGLQESEFRWSYRRTDKHPLEGSRIMYAVIALPPGMTKTSASLGLSIEALKHGYMNLWLSMREDTYDSLSCVLGDVPSEEGAATKAEPNILWDYLYHGGDGCPGPDRERVPDETLRGQEMFSEFLNQSPLFLHGRHSGRIEANWPTDVYLLANAGDLTGATVIYSTGRDDSFVPMSRVKEVTAAFHQTPVHEYDLWKGAIPEQLEGTHIYYRIQVTSGSKKAYLKGGGCAAGGYLNLLRQWVRQDDAPDRDNYHFVVPGHPAPD